MKKYDEAEGVWRTVGGRRIFIKNGQSLSEAMIESGKFAKKDKSSSALEQGYETARAMEPTITADLSEIVEESGGELTGLEFRLKTKESLERKVLSDMKLTGLSKEETLNYLYDVVRYTSLFNSDSLVPGYQRIVEKLREKGYNILRVKNTMGKESASYWGINTVVENPKGYRFELQFHTPQSFQVKQELNHSLYEEQRSSNVSRQRFKELEEQMLSNNRMIKVPTNVSDIKSFDKLKKG
ncbi:hypothetical protein [Holdemania massiliensis]|uniref:hypothetical protein n=1 Tax=Holdemania massiliensis TaxID=1468449 RepID=UPI001F06FA7D|nr:hypothetical protein [Holdemania massiliensis]MCH1940020.1 hypothetical protein [Holdemania massiliensis]